LYQQILHFTPQLLILTTRVSQKRLSGSPSAVQCGLTELLNAAPSLDGFGHEKEEPFGTTNASFMARALWRKTVRNPRDVHADMARATRSGLAAIEDGRDLTQPHSSLAGQLRTSEKAFRDIQLGCRCADACV
jgi:hypothetical protein